MSSVVKGVAKALKEVVEMGGRISDESAEFLDDLLRDKIDDLQEDAQEFVKAADKAAKSLLAEIEERLDEVVARLEDAEKIVKDEPPPIPPAPKKGAVK